ncbi:GNAT family N-acetyltransferase [uncultured Arcticibacterium sp.]|uniref:GNAT family N-acetyltransferase n=1 Tax=uncultured Arcticibacterium sp. TaxID=2173042 RepID=UPI0030F741DE
MRYNPDILETITLEREIPKEESKSQVSIQRLGSQDLILFKQLIEIFKETFDGQSKKEIDEFSLNTMLRHVTFVGFVAKIDNEVIGGLTGYEIRSYYKDESEFFLYNLAVKPGYKKKGFGKLLMKTILGFSKDMGHSRLYVGAHIKGSNAVDFYRNSGATEYKVSKFVYEL